MSGIKKIFGNVEASILNLYLSGREHYLSEICKETKLARPSVLRALRKFEKLEILKIEKKANVKFYTLKKNRQSITLLSSIEYEKTGKFLERREKIRTAVELFVEKTNPLIAVIFGSYAKGYETKESDLDLLLVREFNKNNVKQSEELSGFVYGRTGINVSPVFMSFEDLKKKNTFVNEVVRSHFIIRGSELFYEAVL